MPAKREETPDVLGKLLGEQRPAAPPAARPEAETPPEEKPQVEPTSKPAKKQASKTARRQARKPAPPAPPIEGPKLKATFYLSPETLDFLESAWLKLRRLALLDDRGKVSKSLIVEMALQVALDDLRVKNEKSDIAEAIRRALQEG